MTSRIWFATILLTLAPGATSVAFAYRWERCGVRDQRLRWDHNTVRFRVHQESFPTTTLWPFALEEAAGAWNQIPSNFRYNLTFGEPRVGRRNGQNEVWWNQEFDEFDPPARAKTWFRRAVCQFTEVDILFNPTSNYSVLLAGIGNKRSFIPYGGSQLAFQAAAMHELGHAQGLAHEERVYNVMGDAWRHLHANGREAAAYPGVDAARGSMDTYGRLAPGLNQDLSIAHFKRTSDDGDYSMHGRTQIFDASGAPLEDRGAAEPRFVVRPGQTIQVEFGYESLGVPSTTVMVSYHLSNDDSISTSDPVIATRFIGLEDSTPVDAASTRVTFSLPTWLVPGGWYWIGAFIDPWNVTSEINEANNATYIGIEVAAP
jgi:hypothetical protein